MPSPQLQPDPRPDPRPDPFPAARPVPRAARGPATGPALSFEVFPPRDLDGSSRLWSCLDALAPLGPDAVSVTYGAGGSTRDLTRETVAAIGARTGLRVAAHLTCVGATREDTMAAADGFHAAGARDIVALRGDAPEGSGPFVPHPQGFASSVELVAALARSGRFRVHVGCYPETHPEAADARADLDWLKRKVDAGAASAISQFFFDADAFLRLRDACAARGITVPIAAGVMPVGSWPAARRMAARCGARVPPHLAAAFERAERDGSTRLLALAQATALCERLVAGGVEHLHFYTLNRAGLTRDVCAALGLGAGLRAVA